MAPDPAAWRPFLGSIGGGALTGFGTAQLIERRLAFHSAEMPFAADALSRDGRRRYRVFWLCAALFGAACIVAIAFWKVLPLFIAGFGMGAALSTIAPDLGELSRPSSVFWRWLNRAKPVAGVFVAALLWAALVWLEEPARTVSAILLLLLGLQAVAPLDAERLRFEGLSGVGVMRSLRRHVGAVMVWYCAVGFIVLIADGVLATLLFIVAMGALGVNVARLLAYRVTGERNSNLLVSGIILLCGTIASLWPGWRWLALPVALLAFAWLLRRAIRERWLMA